MPKYKKPAFWSKALTDACERIEEGQEFSNIKRMAKALVDKACEGDVAALREVGDRLEGKPKQSVDMDVDAGGELASLLGLLDRKTRETRE